MIHTEFDELSGLLDQLTVTERKAVFKSETKSSMSKTPYTSEHECSYVGDTYGPSEMTVDHKVRKERTQRLIARINTSFLSNQMQEKFLCSPDKTSRFSPRAYIQYFISHIQAKGNCYPKPLRYLLDHPLPKNQAKADWDNKNPWFSWPDVINSLPHFHTTQVTIGIYRDIDRHVRQALFHTLKASKLVPGKRLPDTLFDCIQMMLKDSHSSEPTSLLYFELFAPNMTGVNNYYEFIRKEEALTNELFAQYPIPPIGKPESMKPIDWKAKYEEAERTIEALKQINEAVQTQYLLLRLYMSLHYFPSAGDYVVKMLHSTMKDNAPLSLKKCAEWLRDENLGMDTLSTDVAMAYSAVTPISFHHLHKGSGQFKNKRNTKTKFQK